jgi:DNA-binding transcriptional ArsR family regulator
MCGDDCSSYSVKEFGKFQKYFRALHCPTRWVIIRLIGEGAKGTNEILEGLGKAGEGLSRSGLYYHLSELEAAGIIEMAGYRELGGGAPEKVWKLKTREIRVDLLEDYPEERGEGKSEP